MKEWGGWRCAIGREESIFNFDMAAFYTKWLRDIRESQKEDGSISMWCPLIGSVILPTRHGELPVSLFHGIFIYTTTTSGFSRRNYRLVKGWVDYLTSINVGHLIKFSKYGDWCPPNKFRSLDPPEN